MSIFNEALSLLLQKEVRKKPVSTNPETSLDQEKVEILAQLAQIEERRVEAIQSGASQEEIQKILRGIRVDEAGFQQQLDELKRSRPRRSSNEE